MKKIIILLLAAIFCGAFSEVSAQRGIAAKLFKDQGTTNLYLGTNKTEAAEGDLNKDGIKDLVIVEQFPDASRTDKIAAFFAIYWGNADGNYKLYKYFQVDSLAHTVSASVTAKGVLRIASDIFYDYIEDEGESGFYEEYSLVYMLRYQENEFRLIGGTTWYHWERIPDLGCMIWHKSYNMLTNKAVISNCPMCDTDHPEVSNVAIKKLPLMKITDITIGTPMFDQFDLDN